MSAGGHRQQDAHALPGSREAALPDRVLRAIAKAEKEIARNATGVTPIGDRRALAAYQEILLLKVGLERETARILLCAADLGAKLVNCAQAIQGNSDRDAR